MILDSVGRISLQYLKALSVYTLTLRFLFHLLPQNAELHHFTNSFPPAPLPSTPEIIGNASLNLNSGKPALQSLSCEVLCPGMYLWLGLPELFSAHSLSSQKQLQN